MPRRLVVLALACAATLALVPPASAQGPAGFVDGRFFAVSQQTAGRLDMAFFGAQGSVVAFAEIVDGKPRQLGTVTADRRGVAVQLGAEEWRCGKVVRRFAAAASAPGEPRHTYHEFDIRTPSCEDRIEIDVPRHVDRGDLVRVRLVDRWRLGTALRLCVSGAKVTTERRCRRVEVPDTSRGLTKRFRVRGNGRLRVAVDVAGHRSDERVAVGTAKPVERSEPRVLVTGDSTSQGVGAVLGDVLGSSARVEADSYPGFGLTTPNRRTWASLAREQVREEKPEVTVISVGANDGYAVRTPDGEEVECCGAAWTAEYRRRVRTLMDIYGSEGRERVLWLTLPTPRDPRRAEFTRSINTAVRTAARARKGIRVLDLHALLSPDGAFRERVAHEGEVVKVRADDGIHLSAAGAEIAGEAIADALEGAGWLDGG